MKISLKMKSPSLHVEYDLPQSNWAEQGLKVTVKRKEWGPVQAMGRRVARWWLQAALWLVPWHLWHQKH